MVPMPLKAAAATPATRVPCREARALDWRPAMMSVESDEMLPCRSGWAKSMPVSMTPMTTPLPVAPWAQALSALIAPTA